MKLPGERTLFFARLFPAHLSAASPGASARALTKMDVALWLAGGQLPSGVDPQDMCFHWRSSFRLSLSDILEYADFNLRAEEFT